VVHSRASTWASGSATRTRHCGCCTRCSRLP
jgi:hypothetical protein